MARPHTFGELFVGIGGMSLGLCRAGWEPRWFVEIDPFCQRVLRKHWPGVNVLGDVRLIEPERQLERVNLIAGGFPCQPHSVAGERRGSNDDRDLWPEFTRIVRCLRPEWVLAENVGGVLSTESGRFFGRILSDLAEAGYDAEWDCLQAAWFGAPHRRERVFILAHSRSQRLSRPVFEGASVCLAEGKAPTKFGNRVIHCGIRWLDDTGNILLGDGVSSELARSAIETYGNAVIPDEAEWLGRRIMEAMEDGGRG